MPKNIRLSREDEHILLPLLEKNNLDMNAYGTVTLYPKIVLQNKVIICSQNSTRVTRRNSYTVTYTDPERPSHVRYGKVEKFLSCPADSLDSIHAAIVKELEVQPCVELESLNFPQDIQCLSHLLCGDFVSVLGSEHKLAIPILCKCFDISTVGLCIITSMVSDSEVLK